MQLLPTRCAKNRLVSQMKCTSLGFPPAYSFMHCSLMLRVLLFVKTMFVSLVTLFTPCAHGLTLPRRRPHRASGNYILGLQTGDFFCGWRRTSLIENVQIRTPLHAQTFFLRYAGLSVNPDRILMYAVPGIFYAACECAFCL